MRHYASLTAILCAALFVASYAAAYEAADRVAIGRAIATLNESPPDALFTAVGNAASELALLRRSNPPFRIVGPSERSVSGPTVTISKEPLGEARINFPAIEPRTVDGSIVFITPDVALARGGSCVSRRRHDANHAALVRHEKGGRRVEDRISPGCWRRANRAANKMGHAAKEEKE